MLGMLCQEQHCQLGGERQDEVKKARWTYTILQAENVLIELLSFKHVHYCSRKGKNDFCDRDSGAEAEADRDARDPEGRATGRKGQS